MIGCGWRVALFVLVAVVVSIEGCKDDACENYAFAITANDVPPDRRMLGRAAWTFLHTTASYLPAQLSEGDVAAFRATLNDIDSVYPCWECRQNYHRILRDAVVQTELWGLKTRDDARLWLWKVHNAVTANTFPTWPMFPEDLELDRRLFDIPDRAATQLRLSRLESTRRSHVLSALTQRWQLSEGLERVTRSNDACPSSGYKTVRMDVFAMSQCPFCRFALEYLDQLIKCDLTCVLGKHTLQGTFDFRLHYVGDNGTKLESLHGPNELVGDKLISCARVHYPMHYLWVKFMMCMEDTQWKIPRNGKGCAEKYDMDYGLLESCVKLNGSALVQKDFDFATKSKVYWTPTVWISHNDTSKYVVPLAENITDVKLHLCRALAAANGIDTPEEVHKSHKVPSAVGSKGKKAKASHKAHTKKSLFQDRVNELLDVSEASFQDDNVDAFWHGALFACVVVGVVGVVLVFVRAHTT